MSSPVLTAGVSKLTAASELLIHSLSFSYVHLEVPCPSSGVLYPQCPHANLPTRRRHGRFRSRLDPPFVLIPLAPPRLKTRFSLSKADLGGSEAPEVVKAAC